MGPVLISPFLWSSSKISITSHVLVSLALALVFLSDLHGGKTLMWPRGQDTGHVPWRARRGCSHSYLQQMRMPFYLFFFSSVPVSQNKCVRKWVFLSVVSLVSLKWRRKWRRMGGSNQSALLKRITKNDFCRLLWFWCFFKIFWFGIKVGKKKIRYLYSPNSSSVECSVGSVYWK